jgi:hypothetical protein
MKRRRQRGGGIAIRLDAPDITAPRTEDTNMEMPGTVLRHSPDDRHSLVPNKDQFAT